MIQHTVTPVSDTRVQVECSWIGYTFTTEAGHAGRCLSCGETFTTVLHPTTEEADAALALQEALEDRDAEAVAVPEPTDAEAVAEEDQRFLDWEASDEEGSFWTEEDPDGDYYDMLGIDDHDLAMEARFERGVYGE